MGCYAIQDKIVDKCQVEGKICGFTDEKLYHAFVFVQFLKKNPVLKTAFRSNLIGKYNLSFSNNFMNKTVLGGFFFLEKT